MDTNIVTLQFSDTTNQVKAVVKFPDENLEENFIVDDVWVQKALHENNFSQYYILPNGIAELKSAVRSKRNTSIVIAEQRDAEINVELSSDNMQSFLTIKPSYGGESISEDEVYKLLEQMGVVQGIDKEAIEEETQKGKCNKSIVANGKPPVDGVDGYFEILVEEDKHFGPTIDENGVANFMESNELSIVQQGDHLIRRVPRTLGENGMDVLGNVIYPVPGENVQFDEELDGTIISDSDENLLVSAIKGHPIIEKFKIIVDPTYVLDKVDITTGNVNFDGSVYVKGDVESNMKIVATGDITVNGCVIKAELEAGKNIVISQGIIGGDLVRGKENNHKRGVVIKCGETLSAAFIDNAVVEAQGNILVKDYVNHSDLLSNGDIVVGSTGYKGHIVGGNVQALHSISSNILGSNTQVKTKVKVGASRELKRKYANKVQQLDEYQSTLNSLSNAFIEMGKRESNGPLNIKSKKVLNTLVNSLQSLAPTIKTLEGEKHSLKTQIGENKTAKIIVRQRVFAAVELNLGDKTLIMDRDVVGGVFELKGDITISPLGINK